MSEEAAKQMVAVIRVRGKIGLTYKIEDTLSMLNLHRKNYMSVYPKNPKIMGMIRKVKDFVTFGTIEPSVLEDVKKRHAEKDPRDPKKHKKYFRLNPPKKGYGRKGIKKSFAVGGALGDRKDKINDLILRMI
jgi:large subunit ribosomal protein L30